MDFDYITPSFSFKIVTMVVALSCLALARVNFSLNYLLGQDMVSNFKEWSMIKGGEILMPSALLKAELLVSRQEEQGTPMARGPKNASCWEPSKRRKLLLEDHIFEEGNSLTGNDKDETTLAKF